jgi:hypothetical protein
MWCCKEAQLACNLLWLLAKLFFSQMAEVSPWPVPAGRKTEWGFYRANDRFAPDSFTRLLL